MDAQAHEKLSIAAAGGISIGIRTNVNKLYEPQAVIGPFVIVNAARSVAFFVPTADVRTSQHAQQPAIGACLLLVFFIPVKVTDYACPSCQSFREMSSPSARIDD